MMWSPSAVRQIPSVQNARWRRGSGAGASRQLPSLLSRQPLPIQVWLGHLAEPPVFARPTDNGAGRRCTGSREGWVSVCVRPAVVGIPPGKVGVHINRPLSQDGVRYEVA